VQSGPKAVGQLRHLQQQQHSATRQWDLKRV
jgi:hypothetical protein